jgi:ribosome biogenesis GTPase / thiamine phosphate phosphatase
LPSGVVMKGIGGFYYIKTPEGIYECRARGIFRKEGLTPLPGDNVIISVSDEVSKKGNLDEILKRESILVRPAVANVNQVAIVLSVRSPQPDFGLFDKLLITAEYKNIDILVCLNKIDLDEEKEYEKIIKVYEKTGYKIILLSTKTNVGLDDLKEAIRGKITVFSGQSGVGKSTILNRIMDSWVMETGNISERNERGKHTTRHAELIELNSGGFIVDTPGFSSFELEGIKLNELQFFLPEFSGFLNKCRFTGCSHISEPGCSVKEAVNSGHISMERYERYIQIYNSLKEIKIYKDRKK